MEEYDVDIPVFIGVEMEGAKVYILKVENSGEILPGSAVVVEIPVVGSGAVVEEAVSAKSDEVVGVDGFDVLTDLIRPYGQNLAAVAFGILTSGLDECSSGCGRENVMLREEHHTSLASSHAKTAGESLYLVTIWLT